jgi:hypothetical protein
VPAVALSRGRTVLRGAQFRHRGPCPAIRGGEDKCCGGVRPSPKRAASAPVRAVRAGPSDRWNRPGSTSTRAAGSGSGSGAACAGCAPTPTQTPNGTRHHRLRGHRHRWCSPASMKARRRRAAPPQAGLRRCGRPTPRTKNGRTPQPPSPAISDSATPPRRPTHAIPPRRPRPGETTAEQAIPAASAQIPRGQGRAPSLISIPAAHCNDQSDSYSGKCKRMPVPISVSGGAPPRGIVTCDVQASGRARFPVIGASQRLLHKPSRGFATIDQRLDGLASATPGASAHITGRGGAEPASALARGYDSHVRRLPCVRPERREPAAGVTGL